MEDTRQAPNQPRRRRTQPSQHCRLISATTTILLPLLILSSLVPGSHAFISTTTMRPRGRTTTMAAGRPPIVILPGFGNSKMDYINPLGQGEEISLEYALKERGFPVYVLDVQRTDWLKFATGAVTESFWAGSIRPDNPSYRWYLEKVASTVEEATQNEGQKAILLGHSAGGWLARAALSDGSWPPPGTDDSVGTTAPTAKSVVSACVTLGSPHFPPSPPVMDMTRGALTFVSSTYPGAYLKKQGISYTTVAGAAVQGIKSAFANRNAESYAFQSYTAVCGKGDVTGDGVVPTDWAHLEGAQQITLPEVFHSINSPSVWYGSPQVVDTWLKKVPGLRY